jgi:hypothetical protein
VNLSSTKLIALYWIGVLAPGVLMFTALLLGWPKPWSPVFTWIGPLISVVVVPTISATPWRRAAYLVLIPVVVVFGLALGTIAPTWFMPAMMVHPN